MSFFISDAMAEGAAAAQPSMGGLEGLLLPLGLIFILYFFMIRPQVKRQKEHKALVSNLQKGDEVQSMGGLMGKITEISENFVKVEVADNVVVTLRRGAIEAVMPKGSLKEL